MDALLLATSMECSLLPAPDIAHPILASLSSHFTWIDWSILAVYLALTTLLGGWLGGKQATIRDFFLGGRKLPWYAVSGSIVATEISAVTLISVPASVFAAGGDLTYLQMGIGAIIARCIVGIWFTRAFYEREIYSPYDYVGNWLGQPARAAATWLFVLGSVLGQSVRVLLTAQILELISGIPIDASIWVIGAFAAIWTLLGGITTVIWTDVIQFFVFLIAMAAGLAFVLHDLPGGWGELWQAGGQAGKLRLWNLSTDPAQAFTLWAALSGNMILCLGAYGTDQMMAQRMFCCKGPRQAGAAIIASSVAQLIAVLAAFIGLGLFAFYLRPEHALDTEAAGLVAKNKDKIFPIFILQNMPAGLVGLIIAGIFAAAISSLDSALAALAQTVVTGIYRPLRERRPARRHGFPVAAGPSAGDAATDARSEPTTLVVGCNGEHGGKTDPTTSVVGSDPAPAAASAEPEAHYLRASKLMIIFWAFALCAMAQVSRLALARYGDILNLALAMATYTWGALLAAFLLALFRVNVNHEGILWGAPLSVLAVFGLTWHQDWAGHVTLGGSAVILTGWTVARTGRWRPGDAARTVALAAGAALPPLLCYWRVAGDGGATVPLKLAWPWNVPVGLGVALLLGVFVAAPRTPSAPPSADAIQSGV